MNPIWLGFFVYCVLKKGRGGWFGPLHPPLMILHTCYLYNFSRPSGDVLKIFFEKTTEKYIEKTLFLKSFSMSYMFLYSYFKFFFRYFIAIIKSINKICKILYSCVFFCEPFHPDLTVRSFFYQALNFNTNFNLLKGVFAKTERGYLGIYRIEFDIGCY